MTARSTGLCGSEADVVLECGGDRRRYTKRRTWPALTGGTKAAPASSFVPAVAPLHPGPGPLLKSAVGRAAVGLKEIGTNFCLVKPTAIPLATCGFVILQQLAIQSPRPLRLAEYISEIMPLKNRVHCLYEVPISIDEQCGACPFLKRHNPRKPLQSLAKVFHVTTHPYE